jgi:hypothetical protein
LVNEEVASFRLELPSLQKSNVPGGVRKFSRGILGFPSGGRVLVSDPKKDPARQILSLSSGETVGTVSFTADNAFLASNPRFALLVNFGSAGVTAAFDLEKTALLTSRPILAGTYSAMNWPCSTPKANCPSISWAPTARPHPVGYLWAPCLRCTPH